MPACRCDICTWLDSTGGNANWCLEHEEWKCRCPCLTLTGGSMLKREVTVTGKIGLESDTCKHHYHPETCCNCPEHMGWHFVEAKTNIVRYISNQHEVRVDGVEIAAGKKLIGETNIEVTGVGLSQVFSNATIIVSPELHPDNTVTAAWTVASIGLEPDKVVNGQTLVRGGVGCATEIEVLTDSELSEGQLQLTSSSGLRFSTTEATAFAAGQVVHTDAPPGSVQEKRSIWLVANLLATNKKNKKFKQLSS